MNQIIDDSSFESAQSKTAVRQFFGKVYAFMFGALLVSGVIAFQYGTPDFIAAHFIKESAPGVYGPNMLFYVILFAPVGIALLMQTMVQRLSFAVLFLLFALYSVLLGFALSMILLQYTTESIVGVFFATAGSFGVMAIMGFVTSADLTKFGSILSMAFIGIFIASIVNFWLGSDTLGYVISMIGVLVFTGLTAYHMQKLKEYAQNAQASEDEKNKMALLGGFTLYVLFINLFLSLLNLFGSRD